VDSFNHRRPLRQLSREILQINRSASVSVWRPALPPGYLSSAPALAPHSSGPALSPWLLTLSGS
jgi:hypothetical protein